MSVVGKFTFKFNAGRAENADFGEFVRLTGKDTADVAAALNARTGALAGAPVSCEVLLNSEGQYLVDITDAGFRGRLGAYNARKPVFWRAAVDVRNDARAFPSDAAKSYYIEALRKSLNYFPLEILAYSIVEKGAYFAVASWDQTDNSLKDFFKLANKEYLRYYNERFEGSGAVFKQKIRAEKLAGAEAAAECMAFVNSVPYSHGLADGYAYKFNGFGKNDDTLTSFVAFEAAAGAGGGKLVTRAHSQGPRRVPDNFIKLPETGAFNKILADVLKDYDCDSVENIPIDKMILIIADLNERGGYSFDYITTKLAIQKHNRYETLIRVLAELTFTFKNTLDESIRNLQVAYSDAAGFREIARDVFILIFDRKGYSYDFIAGMLGFAYPNYPFMSDVIKYYADMRGCSLEATVKKFGIYDNIAGVMEMLRA